jgi:hypothetical protein
VNIPLSLDFFAPFLGAAFDDDFFPKIIFSSFSQRLLYIKYDFLINYFNNKNNVELIISSTLFLVLPHLRFP